MSHQLTAAILTLSLCACGGLNDTQKLKDLSASEIKALCEEFPPDETVCGEGDNTFTVTRSVEDCSEVNTKIPDTCEATVGDLRECFTAPLCEFFANKGCTTVAACSVS